MSEAGRWTAGAAWEPSRHFSYEWQPIWRDHSVISVSIGINEFRDRKPKQPGWRFALNGLTTEEALEEVYELNRIAGSSDDILICRNTTSSNLGRDTIWGRLERPAEARQSEHGWPVDFEIWQRL